MPFGAALVGDLFHNKIDELFIGMPNVFGITDDILIAGFDDQGKDHDEILDKVFQVCRQVNLKLNIDKCYFVLNYVQFSLITENIFVIRQAFASIQHGFFRSAKNVDHHCLIDVIRERDIFLFAKNYNLFFNGIWLVQWFNMDHCDIGRCYAYVWQMINH